MSGANGSSHPPRPRIELLGSGASEAEAAAIAAAIEQFLAETASAPSQPAGPRSAWQRAALEEGVAARQVSSSAWGGAPLPR